MNPEESFKKEVDSVISLFSNGKTQDALNSALSLIESNSEESILFNICGACSASLGQNESAIEYYQQAISIKPDYAKAHFNLAITLQELEQITEAIESYNTAIKYTP